MDVGPMPGPPQSLPDMMASMAMPETPKAAYESGIMGMGPMPLLVKQPPASHPEWISKAKDFFKTTDNPLEAGYIMSDGAMLDFSGNQFKGQGGALGSKVGGQYVRNIDHVQVKDIADQMGGWPNNKNLYWQNKSTPDKFTDLTSSIRMSVMPPDYKGRTGPLWVSSPKVPSAQQLNTIKDALQYSDGTLLFDIVNMTEPTRTNVISLEIPNATVGKLRQQLERYFGE